MPSIPAYASRRPRSGRDRYRTKGGVCLFLQAESDTEDTDSAPGGLAVSGKHFFTNRSTAVFDLDTPSQTLGRVSCQKNNSAVAPSDASKGQQSEPTIPWLKLLARPGDTGGLQEVFEWRQPVAVLRRLALGCLLPLGKTTLRSKLA